MRHRNKTAKLQRNATQRRALLSNLACSLIEHGRIRTTLAKAKALRPLAEKLVTLGKRGDLHARRQAVAFLRQKTVVKTLFDEVAPRAATRQGGYCRITKLGARMTDSAQMAYIEWVDLPSDDEDAVDIESAEESSTDEAPAADETPVASAEEATETDSKA